MPREEAEFEELLAMYCAPVLKGIKVANMFHVSDQQFDDVNALIYQYQKKIQHCGVEFCLFQEGCKRLTIYVYRKCALLMLLHHPNVHSFLSTFGYPKNKDLTDTFQYLNTRLCKSCSYPHEIGIFLGYPLEDVKGFMRQEPCKLVGYWKVYNNPEEAKRLFQLYDTYRDELLDGIYEGQRIERLLS